MTLLKDIYGSIFGKNDESIWRQFASENHGSYIPIFNHRVQLSYKDFTIIFDAHSHFTTVGNSSYEAEYTRGLVEFVSSDSFKLRITKQGFFENIGKLFGLQDIRIGEKEFDGKFIVKSNDEPKTLLMLSNNSITKLLQEIKTVRFDITDDDGLFDEKPTQGNSMLYFVLDGKVKDVRELNKLFHLFRDTLDSLTKTCSIRAAKAIS